jgi:hypothetical protein
MNKFLVGVTVIAVTTLAFAASVHLKPPNRNPTFVDGGLYLQSVGSIAGLGNGDVVVSLNALGKAVATCTNPSGHNQPPGQNPAPVSLTGTQAIPEDEIKNGNVSFNVTTNSPVTPIVGAPDCPNPQWTERIEDVLFTNASLTVEQPASVVVLQVECVFAPPTSNGSVPPGTVSCTITK